MTHPHLLPEWAPVRCVLLAWPRPLGDWQANYAQVQKCYWHLLKTLTSSIEVWLLLPTELHQGEFLAECAVHGVRVERLRCITEVPYNDTWIRDYGPLSTRSGYCSFTFNGWGGKYPADEDNRVPQALSARLGADVNKVSLICEGGALETDGAVLLMNADCVVDEHRNPGFDRARMAKELQATLGPLQVEWLADIALTGDDTDGHIDTIARFAPGQRLIYSGRNEHHPDSAALNSLHHQVCELAARYGWQLFELPTPEIHSELDQRLLPGTYANFLIVNKQVFAPVYGVKEDSQALLVLSKAFPDHEVVPVRCEALLEQHGSLHCATMQIAQPLLSNV